MRFQSIAFRFIGGWALLLLATSCGEPASPVDAVEEKEEPIPKEEVVAVPTFTRDVAPIIFDNCTTCHRPGQSGPFDLLTFRDVSKRAKQIAEATADRYMPPWLPAPGVNSFHGERRLTESEITTIQRWTDQGAVEGEAADLPPVPEFSSEWQLGTPDLVVTLPEPYALPAEGRDIYRNFVIPIPVENRAFVEAMEFRPGGTRVIHHAFMMIDATDQSRSLDAKDAEPGFPGMNAGSGARSPDGHFISWQPGKVASRSPSGMSWRLGTGTDLVLQVHMQTIGKEEKVQPSIGFYFTDEPPRIVPYKLVLRSTEIDIPAGDSAYKFTKTFTLPVDLSVLAVIPHAHYLGKALHGYATLPDGSRKWLIKIDDWDFNWQGDYRYEQPVSLPAGSVLTQEFQFDNSAENVLNPNAPPKTVKYGIETTDEMGELWFQVLAKSDEDQRRLNFDYGRYSVQEQLGDLRRRLATAPDAATHVELAKASMILGKNQEALGELAKAIALDPQFAEAFYLLGRMEGESGSMESAEKNLNRCVEIAPNHVPALVGLGMVELSRRKPELALLQFEKALRHEPENPLVLNNMATTLMGMGRAEEAVPYLEYSLEVSNSAKTRKLLERATSK